MRKVKMTNWTKAENDFIINNYKSMTDAEMAEKLNRTEAATTVRRNQLNLKANDNWTEKEKQILVDNYLYKTDKWIAEKIGKTVNAVKTQRMRLALYKPTGRAAKLIKEISVKELTAAEQRRFDREMQKYYKQVDHRIETEIQNNNKKLKGKTVKKNKKYKLINKDVNRAVTQMQFKEAIVKVIEIFDDYILLEFTRNNIKECILRSDLMLQNYILEELGDTN